MIQVGWPLWAPPSPVAAETTASVCLCAAAGEVCRDGAERLCDGEHGLPDRRHDGQARSPRLLPGGRHGQGAKPTA